MTPGDPDDRFRKALVDIIIEVAAVNDAEKSRLDIDAPVGTTRTATTCSGSERTRPRPYVGLFLILLLAAAVAIPPSALEEQIRASPTVGEYARLAWFAASVATVGGALGSLVESDDAIREALYHPRRAQSG